MRKESFDMSLFFFPSDPKGQCCGCIDTLNAQLEMFFTVIDNYAENVST